MLLHPTIAFNKSGVCLGMLDNKSFIREELQGKKARSIAKAIEEKESIRWIESYRLTNKIAGNYKDKLFINIADREGDFDELLSEYKLGESAAHIIVRAKSDGVLSGNEPDETRKLFGYLRQQRASSKVIFQLCAIDKKRKERTVVQTIKFCRIKLDPLCKVKKLNELGSLEINAILCTEENPPQGEMPVEWLLFTTLDIDKDSTVLEIVKYYQLRWQIEIYFKILKSGCKIEELQLEHIVRLKNAISMYMIVVWRILCLPLIGRISPTLSANLFYEMNEWKALYMVVYSRLPLSEAPSLYVMNRLVGLLGGFLNRKHDKEPGVKSMWIGLTRLKDITLTYDIFNQFNSCG